MSRALSLPPFFVCGRCWGKESKGCANLLSADKACIDPLLSHVVELLLVRSQLLFGRTVQAFTCCVLTGSIGPLALSLRVTCDSSFGWAYIMDAMSGVGAGAIFANRCLPFFVLMMWSDQGFQSAVEFGHGHGHGLGR